MTQRTEKVNRIELIDKTSSVLAMADTICFEEDNASFKAFKDAVFKAWIELNNAIIAECDKSLKSRG